MPKTILIVEDFDDIRDAMRILIEEIHGCKVIEATDGLEAINMAREHRPDLILMDDTRTADRVRLSLRHSAFSDTSEYASLSVLPGST